MSSVEEPVGPPLKPRSPKGRRTRARLVEAAKRVFEERGLTGARVADITQEADVSYGVFYHYFTSKEEVFCEVAEAQEVSLLLALDDTPKGLDPIERIRHANRTYLEAYRRERKIMTVIESVSRYDPAVREVREQRDDEFALRIKGSIESLQRTGRADPDIDPWYAANALGYMVARFAEAWLVQGPDRYDFEKSVDQLTRLWANAVGLGVVRDAPVGDPADAARDRGPGDGKERGRGRRLRPLRATDKP